MKKLIFLLLSFLTILVCKGQIPVVNLDGSLSVDPDGSIVSWQWSTASNNPGLVTFGTPTAAKTTVVPAGGVQWSVGVYKFVLTVTDNLGGKASDTVQVTFRANSLPKANAGPDQSITYPVAIQLGGKDSPVDASVSWSKVYGKYAVFTEPHNSFTKVNYLQPGLYIFQKTVTNSVGQSASDRCYVYVGNKYKLL